jgi:ATP/maltotriose-dependent transcriptional regulator MalT
VPGVGEQVGIVGRDAELRALHGALDALARGESPTVVLHGEPGTGKTLLLRELRDAARGRGYAVASGTATELERSVPFRPVVDALEEFGQDLGGLAPAQRAELSAVFPGHGGGARGGILPAERYLLHDAVRRLLELVAADAPLVLALDDLQWADEASLELLAHTMRRRPRAPVLLALAHRSREAPPPLLDALTRDDALTELELRPLSPDEADELLGPGVPAPRRRALYAESGGNPFYLTELARAGDVAATAGAAGGGTVPRTVAASIRCELARLPECTRLALQAAAVSGDPFEPGLVAEIAEVPRDRVLEVLDDLQALELVRPAESPGRFRFRHPIVRRAVYESSGDGFLLAAHARAAAALARRDGSLAARAHHVERSALPGDDAAIELLSEAGRTGAGRAPAAAARWFGAALRLLPDGDGRRLELLVPYATALAAAGRVDECRAALIEALDLLPEQLELARARLTGLVAGVDHMRGEPEAARALLVRALAEIEDGDSAAACALRLELALDHWLANDWREMAGAARGVLAHARALGDRQLEAEAAALAALGEYYLGRSLPDAEAALAEARLLLDALPDHELAGCVRAALFLGQAAFGMEQHDAAAAVLRRGIDVARSTGQEYWFVALLSARAVAEIWRGRLPLAQEHSEAAAEASHLLGNDQMLVAAHSVLTWTLTLRGDVDGALASAEAARSAFGRAPASALGWLPHCTFAAALVEAGDPDRASAVILSQAGGEDLSAIEPSFRVHWYEVLARADLARGRPEEAAAWLERAEELAAALPLEGRVAELRRAGAEVALASALPEDAAALAREAADGFRRCRQPLDAARAELVLGRALAAAGEEREATRVLLGAREQLAACHADGLVRDAERELGELREDGGAGELAALTSRELEVAGLVATGMTNREIAARLVLSDRTVERHLARIFAKLGIGSRAALAAAVERGRVAR